MKIKQNRNKKLIIDRANGYSYTKLIKKYDVSQARVVFIITRFENEVIGHHLSGMTVEMLQNKYSWLPSTYIAELVARKMKELL